MDWAHEYPDQTSPSSPSPSGAEHSHAGTPHATASRTRSWANRMSTMSARTPGNCPARLGPPRRNGRPTPQWTNGQMAQHRAPMEHDPAEPDYASKSLVAPPRTARHRRHRRCHQHHHQEGKEAPRLSTNRKLAAVLTAPTRPARAHFRTVRRISAMPCAIIGADGVTASTPCRNRSSAAYNADRDGYRQPVTQPLAMRRGKAFQVGGWNLVPAETHYDATPNCQRRLAQPAPAQQHGRFAQVQPLSFWHRLDVGRGTDKSEPPGQRFRLRKDSFNTIQDQFSGRTTSSSRSAMPQLIAERLEQRVEASRQSALRSPNAASTHCK